MASLNPLVSTEWLGNLLLDESLRIADCRWYLEEPTRGREEYHRSHIPAACYLSLDDDLSGSTGPGRHPLPAASEFAENIGRVGIGSEHTVVAYDDRGGAIAARMWWMLRSLGHKEVYVLDGGWTAWTKEPRSTTTEVPEWDSAVLDVADEWTGIIDRDTISSGNGELLLVDARAPERYRGEEEPIDPIAGHIPGAINIPYEGNIGSTDHFLPTGELQERFATAEPDRVIVSYCGSGVTACHNLLALELAGHTGALLYPGSWSDWCIAGGDVSRSERM